MGELSDGTCCPAQSSARREVGMSAVRDSFFATTTASLAILMLVALLAASERFCHEWLGPWITGGDITAVFTFCEGR